MSACNLIYNIRDTKSKYSDIQKQAIKGLPVFTKNKNENVSVAHVNENLLKVLLDALPVIVDKEFDDEMGIYTVSFDKLNMYGEGSSLDEAKEDLVDTIMEWCDIYQENIDMYEKMFDDEYKSYMLKLMRLSCDRSQLERMIII